MTSGNISGIHRLVADALNPAISVSASVDGSQWEPLWTSARTHSLTPYLHQRWLKSGLLHRLPSAVVERFAHARFQNTERNRRLLRELRDLYKSLQNRGIPTLVLKGLPLAQQYYGDLGLRVLYDLDFLIRPSDCSRALAVFDESGYAPFFSAPPALADHILLWRRKNYTWRPDSVFDPEQPVFVELHTRPWEPRWHGFALDCKLDHWRHHQWTEVEGVQLPVPSETKMLVQLAVHYAFNTLESNARLMHLLDVALLLESSGRNLDWDSTLEEIVSSRVAPFCFLTLDMSRRICGSEIPEKIWRTLRDLTPRKVVTWLGLEGVEAAHSMNMYNRERSLIYFLHWAMASGVAEKSQVLLYALQSPWREGKGLERWRSGARRIGQRLQHLTLQRRR